MFSVWDLEEYKSQSIAARFWIKTAEITFCHECESPRVKGDVNPMFIKQADGSNHFYCQTCANNFKQILT